MRADNGAVTVMDWYVEKLLPEPEENSLIVHAAAVAEGKEAEVEASMKIEPWR